MATHRLSDDASRLQDDAERLRDHGRRRFEALRDRAPDFARHATDKARDLFDDQVERWAGRGREVADHAGDELEQARVYVVERVQERPVTATVAALGVGFLLGVLLSGSRR